MPKDKDPNIQDNTYKNRPEFYLPYPPDSNKKPFMSYEELQKGANGAYPKGQK